jgi:uncharacterized protein (UPF0335 family)
MNEEEMVRRIERLEEELGTLMFNMKAVDRMLTSLREAINRWRQQAKT